jgi:predicted phosphodiesterase
MLALLSDIHGNLEALTAVLQRLRQLGVSEVICLGDIVGYGPDPVECLRIAVTWPHVVAGEWDCAISNFDASHWAPRLHKYVVSLQRKIHSQPDSAALIAKANAFAHKLELYGCTFCHATPRDNREFLFPEDVYLTRKLDGLALDFGRTLFVGHTHLAGVFVSFGDSVWEYVEGKPGLEIDVTRPAKLICNVGSVGQPRDGDRRASFVTFNGRHAQFHRVDYDAAATAKKIKDDPDIDDIQGDRWPHGR